MRFRIVLCTFLFAFPALAANVTVGCGGPAGDYPSITAASGIILTGGTASLFGSLLPDGTASATTIQGNDRNAASVLFNATFRAQGRTGSSATARTGCSSGPG